MATFDGKAFDEKGRGGGQGFAGYVRKATIATTEIPGGSPVHQVISTGEGATSFSVPAQGTQAELNALIGAAGDSGSLVFAGGTVTALLVSVDGAEQLIEGADYWTFSLGFLA